MTISGPRSGRIQRRKEIPEAMQNINRRRRQRMRGQEEDNYNGIQRGNKKGNRNEKLKEKRRMYDVETNREAGRVLIVYFFKYLFRRGLNM